MMKKKKVEKMFKNKRKKMHHVMVSVGENIFEVQKKEMTKECPMCFLNVLNF